MINEQKEENAVVLRGKMMIKKQEIEPKKACKNSLVRKAQKLRFGGISLMLLLT